MEQRSPDTTQDCSVYADKLSIFKCCCFLNVKECQCGFKLHLFPYLSKQRRVSNGPRCPGPHLCLRPQTFAVFEGLRDWGETLCAASPNPTTVVTAGASTVVCVWDVAVEKDKVACVELRQVSFQTNNDPAGVCRPQKQADLAFPHSCCTVTRIR